MVPRERECGPQGVIHSFSPSSPFTFCTNEKITTHDLNDEFSRDCVLQNLGADWQ